MKLYIRRSGGIANISLEGEVDTNSLPPELRTKVEALLRVEKLRAISASKSRKMPDTYQYEIRLAKEDTFEAFTLDEGALETELQEILGSMVREIRRRQKSRGDEERS